MTADEVAKSAAVDIAGRVDALPASKNMAPIDIGALIAEGQVLLNQLGNYLPYAVTFLKTLAAIWGGSKTGS